MSERKFNFVSPGIFINEIDNSQLTRTPGDIGPVIIGRTERGPAMRPVRVSSFSEFIEIFGNPIAGGAGTDVSRDGNTTAPTYAAYAAQAWLRNNNAATIVRLLGHQHTTTTSTGKAGWDTTDNDPSATIGSNGGAHGLFVVDSGSVATVFGDDGYGVLAAVLYANAGTTFHLSGTTAAGTAGVAAGATYIKSDNAAKEFILNITTSAGVQSTHRINFNEASPNFIRKVLNTNPTLTNSNTTDGTAATYWLGESYEGMVARYVTGTVAGEQNAFIAPLSKGSTYHAADHKVSAVNARTGWVICQDLNPSTSAFQPGDMQKLFRVQGLHSGEWEQANLKISIQDIKKSTSTSDPYGTFTVVVRKAQDSDNAPRVIERYSGCNLNPNSANYVARKIGDTYSVWDDITRTYRHYGTYPNVSAYIRVEMNLDLDAGGGNAEHLPFGFFGKPRYTRFAVSSSSDAASGTFVASTTSATAATTFVTGAYAFPAAQTYVGAIAESADLAVGRLQSVTHTAAGAGGFNTFLFPAPLLRTSGSDGNPPSLKNTYWGVTTSKRDSTAFDPSYRDAVRMLGGKLPSATTGDVAVGTETEYSYYFTLDDIVALGTAGNLSSSFHYLSGSRQDGTSYRGVATAADIPTGATTGSYDVLLKKGLDRFTLDLHGGFDGLDITEKEPFNNRTIGTNSTSSPREYYNYAFNSVKRAIDAIADPEVAEYNLMVAPGIVDSGLTSHMINVCEDRGDALAIVDLEGDYTPSAQNSNSVENRKGTVAAVVNNLEARALNSSYGCAYYPWVLIRDPQGGNFIWAPPSIAALGTFASSERRSELWFAPAGFRRGGLTDGAAGVPVVNVADRLTASDRDTLYAANINPIATFPAEGIVIFGQKTLQTTPSALDRINVRRLMIYVKKEVSRMATQVLFDQNVQATWSRFLSLVMPFLRSVKARFGLDAYKVVLDETTTTPALVDRNIMYAKIFLKPTKAIEFIALDFTITNDGAAFAD